MKFCFAADVVGNARHWRALEEILGTVDNGWHKWEIEDVEAIEESAWFKDRQNVREFFEKAAMDGVYPNSLHKRRWLVTENPSSDNAMSPQAAAIYFRRPLLICVENQHTDRLLVETALLTFANQELKLFLSNLEKLKPYKYDHAGGNGELFKQIEWNVSECATQGVLLRAVVLTDSDARFPGERRKESLKIEELCKENNIPCMMLSKRAIENYIPDEALLAWASEPDNKAVEKRVNVVCNLTTEQRDHLPMKKKLPADKTMTSEEVKLYASLSVQDRKELQESQFHDKLITLFDTHRQHVTAESLRKRDEKGELERLVAMIGEEL